MNNKRLSKLIGIFAFLLLCASLAVSVVGLSSLRKKSQFDDSSHSSDTQPPSKYEWAPTVIIDAGHGGEDGGAVGINGTCEKELNLAIALELDALLRAEGISTRLTRDGDYMLYDKFSNYSGHKKSQDLAARLAIANEYENAIFVSIHMNSFPQEKYSGLQVYYSENSTASKQLADIIQRLTAENLQPQNTRLTKASEGKIYLLKNIKLPAVLVECGFLSNSEECALLCRADYRHRLCMVLFSSVINYFDTLRDNQSDFS